MSADVLILESYPAMRAGLAAAFTDGGYAVTDSDEPERWVAECDRPVLVLRLTEPLGLPRLSRALEVNPATVGCVLIDDATVEQYRTALAAGATAVCPVTAPTEAVVAAVDHALVGDLVLPAVVASELARSAAAPDQPELPPEDVAWLVDLAGGMTTAELAERVGYSEREMFRMLHSMYQRMGVSNRREALIKATRWGLVDTA